MLDKLYYLYPPVQTIKLPICPQYLYPTSKIIYTEIVVPYRVMRKVKKYNNKIGKYETNFIHNRNKCLEGLVKIIHLFPLLLYTYLVVGMKTELETTTTTNKIGHK